ncbi:FtsX-like permease family protein [Paenibacillus wynnii]|uniref:FtsX-like permease family protein n=1 Tax=Paenibacillus wynnii TaxID=268407 RepID=UPI00278E57FB|nr:ABC transporter permease [Paenibacillus wynnii]MDQ0194061.1 putative ABC transport system permease protein [Paenibacillus wynnii]
MNFPQFAFNNVRRNARAYIAYFLSSSFMVMVFFAYSVFIYHPEITNSDMGPRAATSMQVAAYIVYVFAFFFVLYSISSFLKSRNLEFGLLSILGARPGQINGLIFLENMIIGLFAIVSGIAGGMLLSKFFLLLSTKTIGIGELPFYWPMKAIVITSASFLSLFLVISIFTLLFIRKNKVLELLQGNAKPKKQPKASILLSLFGAALLAVGYYAIRWQLSPVSITLAAVTGIAGTYFFYSQLSVLIMRLLQRSRKSTWRGTRLLWISEMSYKLRDNSRMLFMITVVTAIASMGAGVVLSINQAGREIYSANPFAITKTYYKKPAAEPDRSEIVEQLKAAGVEYTEARADILDGFTKGSQRELLQLLSLSQYMQIAPLIGLPEESSLGLNEAILITSKEMETSDYVHNGMLTLEEQPTTALNIKDNLVSDSLGFSPAEAPLLIVPDKWMDTLSVAKSAQSGRNIISTIMFLYKVPAWDTGSLPTVDSQEAKVGDHLTEWNESAIKNNSDLSFYLRMRASNYLFLKQSTAMLSFISIFVALIFSVSSASFLYFKLHSELAADIRMYRALSKIGLSTSEMSAAATKQIAILFYIPIVVSAIQSLVVISPILTEMGITNVVEPVLTTFAACLILQTVFFLIVKSRYIHSLKKMMV